MYAAYVKRPLDFLLSLMAIAFLSPVLLVLTVTGAVTMGGKPFFVQPRPGKKDKNGQEKIFNLIKFRSMNDRKDKDGNLLPDALRLTRYGKFIRATSLDELPELLNILKGDMSIVGPRPLLVKYIPLYTERQRQRHDVRPGLTGLVQINGRNQLSWEEKFMLDVQYVDNITFLGDMKIIFQTVGAVLCRKGINSNTSATMEEFQGSVE